MSRPRALLRLGFMAAIVTSSLVVVVPSASAAIVTAKSGDVSATFTYEGTFPQSRHARLTITQRGKVVDNVTVRSKWCGNQCWPDFVSPGHSILHVVRLRQHGPLDVVLDLYSGGAHCCTVEQVFSPKESSGAYQMTEYDFGDPGVKLVPLGKGGSDVFQSADDSFAYAFTDYAASGMPIEILSFYGNSFHNVTRSFPRLIETDAKQWRVAFDTAASSHYQDTVGLAAAWAADEDMLGHVATVQRFLRLEARAGHLNSLVSPFQSSGQRFVVQLQNFLAAHGYQKNAS
ncbi:MAG TPA: hypothetical protein VGZ04_02220 [Acidimicrobiales bacterium]|nr:hypothetical protein [Acidimicrobiales bacterium]